jgi:hypothetical protein
VAAAFFLDHLGGELEHGRLMTQPEKRSFNLSDSPRALLPARNITAASRLLTLVGIVIVGRAFCTFELPVNKRMLLATHPTFKALAQARGGMCGCRGETFKRNSIGASILVPASQNIMWSGPRF